jgi:hypothetical protein
MIWNYKLKNSQINNKNLGRAFLKARGFGQCPRKGVSIANYMAQTATLFVC